MKFKEKPPFFFSTLVDKTKIRTQFNLLSNDERLKWIHLSVKAVAAVSVCAPVFGRHAHLI